MTSLEKMSEFVHDRGSQLRVSFALYSVAKDKAVGTPSTDDLIFIAGILNGEVNVINVATAIAVVNTDVENADDASLKATLNALWDAFAKAWIVPPRGA